ncbi:MAG TPA: alpha-L-rhamnosidase N-terminal domain-containing protein, partial [Flavisolibacter sp.]|nr:alpha-L-rhamnosidase N-terminal domain-containing protein [Flavisolibacter sp.]
MMQLLGHLFTYRLLKSKAYALLLFSSLLAVQLQAASPLQPLTLTCEYLVNPLGIRSQKPALTWTLQAVQRNQRQSAYEVIVGDDLAMVRQGKGNAWESGRIMSAQNISIAFEGKPLKPFTRYYWRVKVYNQNGEASDWSEPAWFETAMLKQSDWKGQWIGDERKQFKKDEDFYSNDPMPLFRKAFNTKKKLQTARLYVSGVGYYEAYLNGKKISDHVLDPGWTTYRQEVLYVTHDVTSLLQQGQNTLG